MTAPDLLRSQIDDVGRMLRRTFEGLDDSNCDFKSGNLMSPREQVTHLCVVYMGAKDVAAGRQKDWASYQVNEPSWAGLLAAFDSLRSEAVNAFDLENEESMKHASDYLIGHDHYHVGQMCAVRLAMDPQWDPYCIYS